MRSLASASLTIARYLGSKMCSGRNTFGKSTTFGSGKIGMVGGKGIVDCGSLIVDSLVIGGLAIDGRCPGVCRYQQSAIKNQQLFTNHQSKIINVSFWSSCPCSPSIRTDPACTAS